MSLVEAALCGVPAVATDVGSVREVVEDGVTGRLAAGDPVALADALEAVLAADLGAAARRRAEERFGAAAMVQRHHALYASLTARN